MPFYNINDYLLANQNSAPVTILDDNFTFLKDRLIVGSGAPTTTPEQDIAFYLDTSTNPWTLYVWDKVSASWEKTQVNDFTIQGTVNLVRNGNFFSWSNGTSAAPDGWSFTATGTAPSVSQDLDGSVKLAADVDTTSLVFKQTFDTVNVSDLIGKQVIAKVIAKTTSTTAVVKINDGIGATSVAIPSTGVKEEVVVRHTVNAGATTLELSVEDTTASVIINVYQASLNLGNLILTYQENPLDRALQAIHYQDSAGTNHEYRGLRTEAGYYVFTNPLATYVNTTITFQKPFRKVLAVMVACDGAFRTANITGAVGVSNSAFGLQIISVDGSNLSAQTATTNAWWIAIGVD